ncbi:MAG TPA: hypothetical protein VFD82_19140 [Planctomycetota bacterium]|nr:hypothetical protein [Planctomycetota bacterium]
MNAIFFLTPAAADGAPALFAAYRARVSADAAVTVVAGDADRVRLRSEFAGNAVVPDKPARGKLAFVRELRRQRFDVALVAWTGGGSFQPMRLVALFAGARRVEVLDERGRWFRARWSAPWPLLGHALRRLAGAKSDAFLRVFAAFYRWSIGLLLALPFLAWRWLRLPPARADKSS